MNKRISFVSAAVAAVALLGYGWSQPASAAPQVYLNGQPLATSVAPITVNGSTLVPMRDIFEALGATVQWNALSQSITAQKGDKNINLQIDNRNAIVDGQMVMLNQPAVLVGGRTMVPLRFVSEALGANVDYNAGLNLISINKALDTPVTTTTTTTNTTGGTTTVTPTGTTTTGATTTGTTNVTTTTNNTTTGTAVAGYRTINVPAGVVVPVTLDQELSSAKTQVGQTFTATVASQQLGDSEFPPGTKLEGLVIEAAPRKGADPGVLDFDFRNAVLPNGTRVPIRGELYALDNTTVSANQGRIVANTSSASSTDRMKIIGVGVGAGYLIGHVLLKQNGLLSAVLGGAAGYLYDRSRDSRRAADARLAANTRLGVKLTNDVSYNDNSDYADYRTVYLRQGNMPTYLLNPTQKSLAEYPIAPAVTTGSATGGTVTGVPGTAVAGYREISIPAGVVVPVTLDQALSSATARVGQKFTATVTSQKIGDSEFPANTKLEGVVIEAQPLEGENPGVLDLDFRTALLPDRTRVPIRGVLYSLDNNSVNNTNGRIVAKNTKSNNRLKIIGIGAGAGYVIGHLLLKQNALLSAILGAAGGYLFSNSKDKPAEASLGQGTSLGVRLDDPVSYADRNGYYDYRTSYLRTQ